MKKNYDQEEIIRMYRSGHPQYRIADLAGCSVGTVNKVLKSTGVVLPHMVRKEEYTPILPEEIREKREELHIGEVIWISCKDDWERNLTIKKKCRITEKYEWFCIARDRRGREWCVRYVDLILRERGSV